MHKYPLEMLLRRPVELQSATAYCMAAGLVTLSPATVMGAVDVPWITYGLIAGMALRGLQRAYEGCRLLRYQYELHLLPPYEIDPRKIPVSKTLLFLGMGFNWRVRHTQRLVDLSRREFEHHKDRTQGKIYVAARRFEALIAPIPLIKHLGGLTRSRHWANPVAEIPYTEGNPAYHAVGLWEGEAPVYERQSERVAHKLVIGTTRVGKTRLCEVLLTQDIHNGEVVIVFDPKGDADLLKRCYVEAKRAGREHQFYCFHLGYPEVSARYNPVGSFGRVTEPASRIAGQLPGEGQSATFREFVWRYVNVMSKALITIGKPIDYKSISRYGIDIDPLLCEYLEWFFDQPTSTDGLKRLGISNWREASENLRDSIKPDKTQTARDKRALAMADIYKKAGFTDPTAGALIKTFEYEKAFYDKLVASLFPLLEKLTSGPAGDLLSPDYHDVNDKRPIFDWDTIIRTGGIVYVGLDALSDPEVAQAVGNSMFSDLTSQAGAIYKHGIHHGLPEQLVKTAQKRKICIHADEFNELAGDEFIPMANKAGGAGFQLTVYTQTVSDIVARFGNTAKAGQVVGNLGNIIMLRVKEEATAELLTSYMPDVEVNQLMIESSANDDVNPETSTDFTSGTRQRIGSQRVKLLTTADIMSLPKGHAFAMLGGDLHKLRIPLYKPEKDLPDDLGFLYEQMQSRYASASSNENWFRLPEYRDLPDLGVTAYGRS
jgi:conjugative coupling factor TraD (TOL family)